MNVNYFLRRLLAIALVLLFATPVQASQLGPQVAEPFQDYYARHQGMRILGPPLSGLLEVGGVPAQYFEKGRLEDHRAQVSSATWSFMYGRLTDELMARDALGSVNGTPIRYGDLAEAHRPAGRVPAPSGFRGGTMTLRAGEFIPYHPTLQPAPGYVVPLYFWAYMRRADLFPGGWLHDIGLPMTDAFQTTTIKNGVQRTISMQAFERTVLTYDPLNPPDWQIERGNLGIDALRGQPAPAATVEIPAAGATVTLPLHVLARAGIPGQQLTAHVRWQDGTELAQALPVLRGADGRGLVIGTLNWMNEGQPPQPPTQPATLTLWNASSQLLARQPLTMLAADDPATRLVSVYWLLGEDVVPMQQRVLRTPQIGTAALNELLWGPGPPNLAGFTTALPTPEQVLHYPGRTADWGSRVTLRSLTITDGVATANFSRELAAYGGGSLRVRLIRQQITRTLLQFPTVREVRIAIEGQTEGVLEP